jgi:hypothetical protein
MRRIIKFYTVQSFTKTGCQYVRIQTFFLRRWTGISSYKFTASVVEVDNTDFFRKGPSLPRLGTILCCFLQWGVDAPRSVDVE